MTEGLPHQEFTADAPSDRNVTVLYVDADAAVREATRTEMTGQRPDIAVAAVGDADAAVEVAARGRPDCLVVDPAGIDDPRRLVARFDCPAVLYTDRGPADIEQALLDAAATVVQKGDGERGAFLAAKAVSVTEPATGRPARALESALDDIERRSETSEMRVLVDDAGDAVWSRGSLENVPGGVGSGNVYDELASLAAGESPVARLRSDPTEPVTLRVETSGEERYLRCRRYDLPAAAGSLTLLELDDVTRRARETTDASLLELLTERAQDGLYALDERGVIEFCNEPFADMLGYDPEELRGEHISVALAPGELATGQRTVERLLGADGDDATVDLTFQHTDGTDRETTVHCIVLHDADAYRGLMGVVRDVTDRTEQQRALEQTTERLELALEGAELGVWDWNVETGAVTFDERWAGMLGYSTDELDQRIETWESLVHPEDLEPAWNAIEAHLDGETDIYRCDYRLRTASGEYKWIRDIGRVSERDADGEPVRAVGIHQDITERKRRQRRIEAQRDELATVAQAHHLIQDVIRALGSAASRTDIADTVCTRLVESDLYELAWIGRRAGSDGRLARETVAGDGQPPELPDRERGIGREAVRTGDVQVVRDLADETAAQREDGSDRTLRSAVAVPLCHDEAVHGALVAYANRADAFGDRAVEAFAALGEIVGFAFTAVQNRQLLARDRLVEMEFRSEDAYPLPVTRRHDCRLELSGAVDLGENGLQYLTVDGAQPSAVLDSLLERPAVLDGRVVREDGDAGVVELRVTATFKSQLLDSGARLVDAVADSRRVRFVVEAPTDGDPRTIRETISTELGAFNLVAKRERERRPNDLVDRSPIQTDLTDRQLEVLRAAYLAGYYEWPRDTTAEQLADTLDISSPTLHQHLRRAERNLLDGLLDS